MNEYGDYDDDFDPVGPVGGLMTADDQPFFLQPHDDMLPQDVDFDDPAVVALPRVLLMGPRRSGKTSIQVCVCARACVAVQMKTVPVSGLAHFLFCYCFPVTDSA